MREPPLIATGEGIGRREFLGQTNRAEFETATELHAMRGTEGDFRTAAADVDDDRRAASKIDGVCSRKMDESGFLSSGNRLDMDADVSADGCQKVSTVRGLADRARGRGDDLVDAVGLGQPLEFGQGLHGRSRCGGRKFPALEAPCAQPNHVLFAVNYLK
jgi:hypothetical protein